MPEQDPSRFETFASGIKESFRSTINYVESKAAIGLIGAGAVGLTGGAIAANQANTEPAQASAAPDIKATASDLQQDCGRLATVKPQITNAYITAPHNLGGDKVRSYSYRFGLDELPPECGRYIRVVSLDIHVGKKSMGSELIAANNDKSGGPVRRILYNRITGDYNPYNCRKGPGKTPVTATITPKLRDPRKRQVMKRRTYKHPFRVRAAC